MKLTGKLLTTGLVAGGVLGTVAVVNKVTESLAGELNTALKGEERRYPWKYGDIFYVVKGARDAKPLLFIHGFAPGASSYEWRKNIEALAVDFRVYALDLLGFGLSDRPSIDYTAETFSDLISDFIKEAIGKPTIVVAHGLTCAYVIADAYRHPKNYERLVLVSPPPTILEETMPAPLNAAAKFALRAPVIGPFTYNMLASRRAIRTYYDRQGYHNLGLINDDLIEYIYTSAHQPNAHLPVAAFLNNYLAMDVQEPLARLQMPVVALWGREGALAATGASSAFKRVNPRIETHILNKASQQLQDEQSGEFNSLLRAFAGVTVQ